jgi:hypothetical protein
MTVLKKIDSNVTGLSYAEEASLGVLPGSPVWVPMEPNTYSNFGGQLTTVAREPINAGRQRRKGTVVDLSAGGSINTDLTQTNIQDLLQGFFFADLRKKYEHAASAVTTGPNLYDVASTAGVVAGSLLFASGFTNAANNGLHTVASLVASTSVTVTEATAAEGSPPATNLLVRVGHEGASGDLTIDVSGTLPAMKSTTLDFTTLGLVPGEWLFIGGDTSDTQFLNAVNSGFARIHSVAAHQINLDKVQDTFVTDAGTAKTVQFFFGRVLKNEANDPTLIKRRTYHIERTLGVPDDALPSGVQAEYLIGSVPSTAKFNFKTAAKIDLDLDFVGTDNTQVSNTDGLLAGDRPVLVSADAFNTSSDFARLKMSVLDPASSNPSPLFAFLSDFTVTIDNKLSPNKAISVLGAFEVTAGFFNVDATATAYFSEVAAVQAVRDNADVTIDYALVKNETVGLETVAQGIVMDIPLVSLGDGRLNVAINAPITLALTIPAAGDRVFNHTMLMSFFDYLPQAALPA